MSRLRSPFAIALLIAVAAAATVGGAWVFEAFGYAPCELCLKERIAYYVGVPLALLVAMATWRGPRPLASAGFVLLAVLFAGSTIFGVYHAGVEWGFWPGPADCTGTLQKGGSIDDFMKQLQTVKVVRCDAVAIRVLGLSLAGWNAVISAALAVAAAMAVSRRQPTAPAR